MVECVVVCVSIGVGVQGLESLPEDFCGFIARVPPGPVGNAIGAWGR